jgi:hypothetical protein
MLSKLVPQLIALGYIAFVLQPIDKVNANAKPPPLPLQELTFFERTLLQDHVIPFLGSNIPTGAKCMTMEKMKHKYGIMVEKVPTVNSLEFLQTLKDNYIGIGLLCAMLPTLWSTNHQAFLRTPRIAGAGIFMRGR